MWVDVLQDVIDQAGVTVVSLNAAEMEGVAAIASKHRLDFDDAYQYVAAETYDLILVSLDSDFDRTVRGRVTPGALLAEIGADSQDG